MAGTTPVSIWIDEANVIFRRGLASCLAAAGVTVAGESSLLEPVPDLRGVDVLLLDLDFERVGWRQALELARQGPTRLVGLVRAGSEQRLFDAVAAGLAGFLVRSDLTPERLVACVRSVTNGHDSHPSDLLARLLDELASGSRRGGSATRLAPRELDVLRLLADGDDTRAIADRLSYSERTIKNIVHDVMLKLNCRTRAHAVAMATRQGFI